MKKSLFIVSLLCAAPAYAANIGEVSETDVLEQMLRFFLSGDPAVTYAVTGAVLLGICCGLLGSFIVVRKMALMGDALSHAVLPGVAAGFLWNSTKDPVAIFVGATIAGLIGTSIVSLITRTTRLKEDTAIGLVLASFFAVGICMVTMIQRLPTGNKSGIDKFLFGQAAAMGTADIQLMAVVTLVTVILVAIFYKELLITSFDDGFARSIGMPVAWIHHLLMLLLGFSVVVSLQAVGVVLVSAMLITPASAAYLLTDRMHRMLFLAALFGVFSGVLGAFLSFLGNNLPTGPFMVLGASTVFAIAFFFAPRHGVIMKAWRHMARSERIQRENTLKALYHVLEDREFHGEGVSLEALAEKRRSTLDLVLKEVATLKRHALVSVDDDTVYFTPDGWAKGCAIVRNHRLWELYLTNEVHMAADHVHEDAEKIEHVLGEEAVRALEKRLQYPRLDPHGRPIPSLEDVRPNKKNRVTGYG